MKISIEKISAVYLYLVVGWALSAGALVFFNESLKGEEFYVNSIFLLAGDILLILVSLSLLLVLVKFRRLKKSLFYAMTAVLLLMFVVSLKVLYLAGGEGYLHYFGRNFLAYFFVSIVVVQAVFQVDSRGILKIIDRFYFFLILGCVSVSVLFFFVSYDFFWGGNRLTGTLINHNSLAFVLAFFCIFYFSKMNYLKSAVAYIFIVMSGSVTGMTVALLFVFFRPIYFFVFISVGSLIFYLFMLDDFSINDLHFVYKIYEILNNPDTHLTSASARLDQWEWFYENVLLEPVAWIIGVLDQSKILLFDSQYYNFVSNFGFISSLSFFMLIAFAAFRGKCIAVSFYLIWSIFAFSLTAFLSRWNVMVFYFFIIGVSLVLVSDRVGRRQIEAGENLGGV